MKKLRNKILSAVLVLSLLLTSSSFAFAVGDSGTDSSELITNAEIISTVPSSVQSGYEITKAFNNNTSDYWHTNWTPSNDTTDNTGLKRSVMITFDDIKPISKISYTPRTGSGNGATNGRFEDCVVYADKDNDGNIDVGENSTDIVGTWHFDNNDTEKIMSFETPVITNKLIIYGKHTYGDNGSNDDRFANAAEIKIYKEMSMCPNIIEQPMSTISDSQVTLNVIATASDGTSELTYQWYSYTDDISRATEVIGATSASITVDPTETLTYYFVKVTQTVAGNTTSVNSDSAYVKLSGESRELTQINIDNGLSIIDYSSLGSGSSVAKAIDKTKNYNAYNFWETMWDGTDTELYMTFDLGQVYSLAEVNYYYGRVEGTGNGVPKKLEIWTSTDNINWTLSKIGEITGTLQSGSDSKYYYDVRIPLNAPTQARYVKFHPFNNEVYVGSSFAIGEAEFFVDLSSETLITQQPVLDENGQITIGTASDASIQWYKNSTASYEGAVEISDATNTTLTPSKAESVYYFAKVTKGENNSVFSEMVYVQSEETMIEREGGNYYGPLSDAIANAASDETIQVLRNIDLNSSLNIDKELTIKSAGETSFIIKRASGCTNSMFNVNSNGNLTFDNVVVDGGAVWKLNGEDSTPAAGATNDTANGGIRASGNIVNVAGNSIFTVGAGATLQNNDAAGSAIVFAPNSTVNIEGKILNNRNDNNAEENPDGFNGGAACGQGTMNVSGNAEISGNYAKSRGGAITIWGTAPTLNINGNAQIHDNKCGGSNNSGANARGGGAICVDAGTLNIGTEAGSDVKIYNNESYKGGGAVAIENGTINIDNCEIYENHNTQGSNGGVIFINAAGIVNLNGGTIRNNEGYGNGGVIFINAAGTVNLNGGTIRDNVGHGNGAIYLAGSNSKVNVGDVTMSGNTVADSETVGGIKVGTAVNYFNGKVTITGNPNFSDDTNIFKKNSDLVVSFAESCDLTNTINIVVQGAQATQTIAEAANVEQAKNLISYINIPTPNNKVVYCSGTSIKYGDPATYSTNLDTQKSLMLVPGETTASTTLSVTATGTDVTYKWYSCDADGNNSQLVEEQTTNTLTLNSLEKGSTYYYCVINNGDESTAEPKTSTICEVKVTDFYPCSKAIDKFKNV